RGAWPRSAPVRVCRAPVSWLSACFPMCQRPLFFFKQRTAYEVMTGRFMQWAAKRGLDRLLIVNKIDADNVDLEDLLERIQQTFGKECLPLNLPAADRRKVSDCFFAPSGEADFSSVDEAHRKLVDQVVEEIGRASC